MTLTDWFGRVGVGCSSSKMWDDVTDWFGRGVVWCWMMMRDDVVEVMDDVMEDGGEKKKVTER